MSHDDAPLSQPPMSLQRNEFPMEIVKLLLQIAWADLEIEDSEREKLLAFGSRIGLHPEHVEEIKTYLSGDVALPPPNLGLLRERKYGVLKSIEDFLGADGDISEEDAEVLDEIRMFLG